MAIENALQLRVTKEQIAKFEEALARIKALDVPSDSAGNWTIAMNNSAIESELEVLRAQVVEYETAMGTCKLCDQPATRHGYCDSCYHGAKDGYDRSAEGCTS